MTQLRINVANLHIFFEFTIHFIKKLKKITLKIKKTEFIAIFTTKKHQFILKIESWSYNKLKKLFFLRKKMVANSNLPPFLSKIIQKYYYFVAFSRRFIIEKMNNAEIKHNTTSIVHKAHNGSPPQSIPITDTR